jgi:hypothetical protein
MAQPGKQGTKPPASISTTNDAWTRVSKFTPPPPVENGLLSCLFVLFIMTNDENTLKRSLFGYGNYKLVIESVQEVRFLEWGKLYFLLYLKILFCFTEYTNNYVD